MRTSAPGLGCIGARLHLPEERRPVQVEADRKPCGKGVCACVCVCVCVCMCAYEYIYIY